MAQNSDGTGAVSTNGDPVAYLRNKAGTSFNATQPTNNLRPTLLTAGINGRASLSVASTSIAGFSSIGRPTNATSVTYIVVARFVAPSGFLGFVTLSGNGSATFADASQPSSSSAPSANAGTPTYRVNRSAVSATRSALWTATNGINYVLSARSLNLSAWTTSDFALLSYPSPFNFAGTFAEAVIYNRSLSDAELLAVESALSAKWGLP
jgi:hypothetical protein